MIYFICSEFTMGHDKWCKENNINPFYVKPYSLCNFSLKDTVIGKNIELTKPLYYLGPCNVDEDSCDYGFLINDSVKPDYETINHIVFQHAEIPFDANDKKRLKFLSFTKEIELYDYLLNIIRVYDFGK